MNKDMSEREEMQDNHFLKKKLNQIGIEFH